MCLNPIKLYNPAKKISLLGGQRFQIEVPCGNCAECREAKRTDIYFRTYYECEYTWLQNGFVYFDTLSYRTDCLPHVSDFINKVGKDSPVDFSCFNREDFRLFMVRLRRQLEYHGFDVKNNLKYFVASEYGSDKEYVDDNGRLRKATQRPHYHVLFFVTGDIDVITFSQYVNKCWQKGNTDGVDYKGYRYVIEHTFGPKYNNDKVHMRSVANYVAKYVLKDNDLDKMINHRILSVYGDDSYYTNTLQGKRAMAKIKRCISTYTKWSNGYGLYGLQYNDSDLIYDNKMRVPDKEQVWRYAPLSSYLNRKAFYETVYNEDGKLLWRITDKGRERAFNKACTGVEQLADRMKDWYDNIDTLLQKSDDENLRSIDIYEYQKKLRSDVEKYLNGRSWTDYAFYIFFYKGRVKSLEQRERESKGIYVVDDVYEFFWKGLITNDCIDNIDEKYIMYNYSHYTYRQHFGERLISDQFLGDKDIGMYTFGITFGFDDVSGVSKGSFREQYNKGFHKVRKVEEWAELNVINENSDPRFADFDKLYNLYVSSLYYKNKRKQDCYDYIENMKKRLKCA